MTARFGPLIGGVLEAGPNATKKNPGVPPGLLENCTETSLDMSRNGAETYLQSHISVCYLPWNEGEKSTAGRGKTFTSENLERL
jgi:hypothetical protein